MEAQSETRTSHKGEFVKATNVESGEVKFYKNGMEASREIGCSHVLAYKVLKNELGLARGWRLEYIDKDDPQCTKYKRILETRMRNIRQSLVEYAHE